MAVGGTGAPSTGQCRRPTVGGGSTSSRRTKHVMSIPTNASESLGGCPYGSGSTRIPDRSLRESPRRSERGGSSPAWIAEIVTGHPYTAGMPTKPRLIDLFAGCGGMTQGFVDAGYLPVAAVEHDPEAAATYAANFGEEHAFYGDLEDWPTRDIPTADVVIGGPPCQGFSNLGSKDVDD